MRKSFFIETKHVFGASLPLRQVGGLVPSLPFSDGEIIYRKKNGKSCIEQEFKGRLGYLQQYDIVVDEEIILPLTVTQPDLYVAYIMHATQHICLSDTHDTSIVTVNGRRAFYLYLPPAPYCLHLSAGKYHLFGFYFDVGIFDYGGDLEFDFLQPLLEAHRRKAPQPVVSMDFRVGPVTESYIGSLCKNLKKGDLDGQVYIISQLKELIKLSKQKIDSESGIQVRHHDMLQHAKNLIEQGVDAHGMDYAVSSLTKILPMGEGTLYLLFKKHFGITPTHYKKNYIIEKSKMMLITGDTVFGVADKLGFKHGRSFYRVFKKHTSTSPKVYTESLKKIEINKKQL